MNKCGDCKHFIGLGDWNLCCKLKYDLCYEWSDACEKYEEITEPIDMMEE